MTLKTDLRLGMHTSIAGGLHQAIKTASDLGSDTLQIFSRNPRGWLARKLSTAEIEQFIQARAATDLTPLVIHACYLINLAAQNQAIWQKSLTTFRDELVRACTIGADYLVVHPGCATGASTEAGIVACAKALKQACKELPLANLMILLENTAGQGSSIGCSFVQLREILDLCPELPLGICLDTAHCYAAGYDITTPIGFDKTWQEICHTITIEKIKLIHCNDSKVALGSRVDRHWHIGEGQIGVKGFELILSNPVLRTIPFILETPIDKIHDDKWNFARLREIAASCLSST